MMKMLREMMEVVNTLATVVRMRKRTTMMKQLMKMMVVAYSEVVWTLKQITIGRKRMKMMPVVNTQVTLPTLMTST